MCLSDPAHFLLGSLLVFADDANVNSDAIRTGAVTALYFFALHKNLIVSYIHISIYPLMFALLVRHCVSLALY